MQAPNLSASLETFKKERGQTAAAEEEERQRVEEATLRVSLTASAITSSSSRDW